MRHYFQDLSRQSSKRERTRSVLIDGAIATVAERGLSDASIKAITESVGLSNGTFYNHFDDREQLFREAAIAAAEAIADQIAAEVASVDEGIGRIVISTDAFIKRTVEQPDWAAMIVDAAHHIGEIRHDLGRHLRADVAMAVELGELEEAPNRFLIDQVGALVALGIEAQLKRGRNKKVRRQTCEAVLRLLGLTPVQARRAVGRWVPELE